MILAHVIILDLKWKTLENNNFTFSHNHKKRLSTPGDHGTINVFMVMLRQLKIFVKVLESLWSQLFMENYNADLTCKMRRISFSTIIRSHDLLPHTSWNIPAAVSSYSSRSRRGHVVAFTKDCHTDLFSIFCKRLKAISHHWVGYYCQTQNTLVHLQHFFCFLVAFIPGWSTYAAVHSKLTRDDILAKATNLFSPHHDQYV